MTDLIGTHQIPCLNDDDYAAYALYMQCVAQRVEADLVANKAQIDAARFRPARGWTRTDVNTPGGGSTNTSATIAYTYNWPGTVGSLADLVTLNRQGWWNIGFNTRAVSNTPVVPNWRIIDLAVFAPTVPSALRTFTSGEWTIKLEDIVWESNTTGGEVLTASADVYNPGNPEVAETGPGLSMLFGLQLESGGVETVTLTTNIWAVFLGDTPNIGTA